MSVSEEASVSASSDLERAKQIVTEIIRCAGGRIEGKTRLFKIFYFAHLLYAKAAPDYLSEWPIVRMPHGPGIGDADLVLDSLADDDLLEIREKPIGPYVTLEYRTTATRTVDLPLEAIDAIRRAVEFVGDQSASELSELTHQFSHCWRESEDGDTLNIYVDLLTENQYLQLKQRTDQHLKTLRSIGEL